MRKGGIQGGCDENGPGRMEEEETAELSLVCCCCCCWCWAARRERVLGVGAGRAMRREEAALPLCGCGGSGGRELVVFYVRVLCMNVYVCENNVISGGESEWILGVRTNPMPTKHNQPIPKKKKNVPAPAHSPHSHHPPPHPPHHRRPTPTVSAAAKKAGAAPPPTATAILVHLPAPLPSFAAASCWGRWRRR